MVPDVAQQLAPLADRQDFTEPKDLVFGGELGRYQDASSIRIRYRAALRRAGLRQLRFHEYADVGETVLLRAISLQIQST